MDSNITKAIVGVFGCLAIGIAYYVTKSGYHYGDCFY